MTWHPLLLRQLAKVGIDPASPPVERDAWHALLARVSQTYMAADQDRALLERSLDISSREMREALDRALAANTALLESQVRLELARAEAAEARIAAEAASRAKSEFLANVSHEIRTPMTAILGFVDLLVDADPRHTPAHIRREYAETIRRHGEHLLALINDILDLSKIEAGRMQVERIPTSVVGVVEEVLSLMRVRSSAKGLELAARYETPVPRTLLSDPLRLRQILINLVGNAIKFTERGGVTLTVRADPPASPDGKLTIQVRDTGMGMTPDQLSRVFRVFEQADASVSRRFGGTGLGLCISKRLAELLGGTINVESTPGQGSVFSVSIPTGPVDDFIDPASAAGIFSAASREDAKAAALSQTPLAGVRVLLAEDSRDNQRLIAYYLRRAGATLELVSDGRGAVAALCRSGDPSAPLADPAPFDVVVLDMQMPVMDGYTTATLLRNKGATLPIIALTAHAMSEDRARCLAAGCSDYLTKPIDAQALIHAVASAARAAAPPAESAPPAPPMAHRPSQPADAGDAAAAQEAPEPHNTSGTVPPPAG